MTILDTFKARIQGAKRVVITTHIYPDADGIGSEISLCLALRRLGVETLCVNDESLQTRYQYLDPEGVVKGIQDFDYAEWGRPDLWIVVDTNTVDRVCPTLQPMMRKNNNVLFIDHHPPVMPSADHCINERAAATGQVVGELILGLGLTFDPKLALPLYTAIIIDTSSFRYPNVNGETHQLIAKLMQAGITPASAYNGIYGAKKIEHMHLLGTILSTAQSNQTREIAWISLSKELIHRYSSDVEDTHAFINHLLVLEGIKIACMFRDDGDSLKVSLRSSGEWDVGEMARRLGGGGHSHSAATILPKNHLDSTEALTVSTIKRMEMMLKELKT
jgi:phosphoesterase RecJ-like protein